MNYKTPLQMLTESAAEDGQQPSTDPKDATIAAYRQLFREVRKELANAAQTLDCCARPPPADPCQCAKPAANRCSAMVAKIDAIEAAAMALAAPAPEERH